MAGAINYTVVTDTSADWASVANSTYFYDKADKLVHYKDSTGVVQEIFSGSGITVGTTAVTSGTDGRVFFQAGGVVQQDANFTYDNTLKRLGLKAVGTAATDIPFQIQNSAGTQNIISAQGDGKTTFSNSMLEIENNDVTGIGYTRLRKITVGTFNKGSELSLFKNDNTSNIEIVRFQALSEGGVFVFPESAGTKSIQIGSSLTVGNNGGVAMYSSGTQTHNIQIRNQFHNVFHVTGIGAQATLRIGNAGTNVNFFNVHGNNAGNLTTNPIFTINSSGTVGIGTEASTPGARLDVRAQGALSTDLAFRVRNSADSANILTVQGNGTIVIPSNPKIDTTAGTFIQTNTFGSLYVGTGNTSIANYTNTVFGNSNTLSGSVDNYVVVGSSNSINGMRNIVMGIGNTTSGDSSIRIGNASQDTYGGNSSIHLGRSGNGGFITYSANEVFNVFFNDYRQSQMFRGNGSLLLSGKNNTILTDANVTTFMGDGGNTLVVRNHTSVPSTNITDSFQQYSADITAGNAAPHFRTEVGDVIKLYKQSSAGIATVGDLVTILTNLGLLG
jgi:hypothetical protein